MTHIHQTISGKSVWIVEDHHHALDAWATIRQRVCAPPALITFDHHTDLREAFLGYCFKVNSPDRADREFRSFARSEAKKIDFRQQHTVVEAIAHLRHDEHIHAAHLAGIIGKVYVSLAQGPVGCRRSDRWCKIYHNVCVPPCRSSPHDDTCSRRVADHAIDDKLILRRIARIEKSWQSTIEEGSFILDIDLDVFASEAAVKPKEISGFYRLIRSSLGITIAMERECVEYGKLEGEVVDADMLLMAVKSHISEALK